jgi:hypothetical protein
MRHDRADDDLQQQNRGHDEKIFADPALAVGQRAEFRQNRILRLQVGSFR